MADQVIDARGDRFVAGNLALTGNGRELAFTSTGHCASTSTSSCKKTGWEERAVSPATAGGDLDSSRVLMRQKALRGASTGYINASMLSPDGSTLAVAVMHSGDKPNSDNISVVQASAITGKQLRVLYRMNTGNGAFYGFVTADPTGRFVLFDAGRTGGTVNGWVDQGRLRKLTPADGSNVFWETW